MSEDEGEFYYPDEVQDGNASFQAGYQHCTYDREELPNSQDEIETFIADQKAQNTVRKTRSDLNILKKYMESIGKGDINIKNLPTNELDHLLCKFFMNVKKPDGSDYEPNTLSSYQRSIHRHLQDLQYTGNILKDEVFEKSRKVLSARRKSLVASGKGNNPETTRALTDEEEDLFFASGQFGDSGPEVLQRTLWWLLSLQFGFRARDESRKLRWGDVQLQKKLMTATKYLLGWEKEERKPEQDKKIVTREHFSLKLSPQMMKDAQLSCTRNSETTVLLRCSQPMHHFFLP